MRLVLVGAISVSRSYWQLGTLVMSLNIQTIRPRRGIEVKAGNCAIHHLELRQKGRLCLRRQQSNFKNTSHTKSRLQVCNILF